MTGKLDLGTRHSPTRLRLLVIALLGATIAILMNVFVWTADAKAADTPPYPDYCFQGVGWISMDCSPLGHEINTSKDLRQAAGNAAVSCAAGWWFGGPVGCKAGAIGAILTSIPFDGTWD